MTRSPPRRDPPQPYPQVRPDLAHGGRWIVRPSKAMAPLAPLGRERVLALVAKGPLPISFGSPHPTVMVLQQDGMFRIRGLVVDQVAAEEAAAAARRARSPSWMPEHYYALGQPTGEVFAEADTLEGLIDVIRTMTWPDHW